MLGANVRAFDAPVREHEAAPVLEARLRDDAALLRLGDLRRDPDGLLDRDGREIPDLESRRHRGRDGKPRDLTARLVEKHRDEPAVRDPWSALEALREDVLGGEAPVRERPIEPQSAAGGG